MYHHHWHRHSSKNAHAKNNKGDENMIARKYKDVTLNQAVILIIDGKPYWLMYDNPSDDYLLVGWRNDESMRLGQGKTPAVAKLSHFDENLFSKDFGKVEKILEFKTGYSCLCYLQHKSSAEYRQVKVDKPRKITMEDIHTAFGENIILEL